MSVASRTVLLRGGRVYSDTAPAATAVVTRGDRIGWLGVDSATPDEPYDDVIDLAGRLVAPGFVDAHVHLAQTGRTLANLDLSGTRSLAEALDALAQYAARGESGALYATGWDETSWPEGRPPRLAELDRAVGRRPAYVLRVDAHSALASSALLAATGDAPGLDGWLGDGLVAREAHHAVRAAVDRTFTETDRAIAIRRALRCAATHGVTSVHEVNAPHISAAADAQLVQSVRAAEPLPEVACYWGALRGEGVVGTELADIVEGFAGDLSVDGSVGSRTARLRKPYVDSETSGYLYLDAAEIADHVAFCTRRGVQAGFHVIGQAGMDTVVEGLTRAAADVGAPALRGARHRLEHVEMVSPDQLAKLAGYGVVASVQPAFDAAWGAPGQMYEQRLGPGRAAPMNPFASMQRAGLTLAFGSDSPVTPIDPWHGVRSAVHHHNPDERLSPTAAFAAHTVGGHRARRDDSAGSLAVGASATYAVWDLPGGYADDAALPALDDGRPNPVCVCTTVDGETVYSAEGYR